MRIKDAINRVLWSEKDKSSFSLVIRDREKGSSNIPFDVIERVDNTYIYLKDSEDVIPLHRVLEIRKGKDLYWSRYPKPDL
ncbi:DUF504 domain-containing protein [Stygiolobus caldivivus]|uniref:UPF0248 protein KN1_27790 n=1 Tax=Stygiolobus caldivivus TaxID=2824673 RepID=A0A8D5U9M9_9CREN|nr:RNA repair domain-containing protein [Stygiolobus caldivivus]BCU71482.1 hypothetical protein KN1_27790 [Stygiolobus caldivivus]